MPSKIIHKTTKPNIGPTIVILDFGSQYTQLIARRVRELGVYSEIYPHTISADKLRELAPQGLILSGGPATTTKKTSPRIPTAVFSLGCPVLGICYGMQALALQLGGKVAPEHKREFGLAQVVLKNKSGLFAKIKTNALKVWMSHGDQVTKLPSGFVASATTTNTKYAAIENVKLKLYGVQFHPEVTHTEQGKKLLANFVYNLCACQKLWTPKKIVTNLITKVKEQVNTNEQVVLGLSGGVDSAVTALLLHQAIGKRLTCIFVDTGLLRLNEALQLKKIFAAHFGIKVIHVNAKAQFYRALKGITDPELKRKIVGHEFIKVFEREAKQLKNITWLAQGTIYPDVIESAQAHSKTATVIKSHHNVGGLPKTLKLKLLEPIRELFKDEVRKIGLELGLTKELLYRHPFPGPGLAVRIVGEISAKDADKLRLADNIFIEELINHNLYHKVSQAFAVLLPVKSVGVMGDGRKYDPVLALRAVVTTDFMTADWARLPYTFLARVALRIVNEVLGISRVVYDITGKPPATIEWE